MSFTTRALKDTTLIDNQTRQGWPTLNEEFLMPKYYLTFGRDHRHVVDGVVFDKDCVAEIEANDYGSARDMAFSKLGAKWCFMHENIDQVEMRFYPRGVIRWIAKTK